MAPGRGATGGDAPGEPVDLALYNYIADYPDPYDFINFLFHEESDLSKAGLFTGLCAGTHFDRRMNEAAALTGDERYRTYAALEHDLIAKGAPIVPYASGTTVSLFSERIGCQVQQPIYGIDLGRLCLR